MLIQDYFNVFTLFQNKSLKITHVKRTQTQRIANWKSSTWQDKKKNMEIKIKNGKKLLTITINEFFFKRHEMEMTFLEKSVALFAKKNFMYAKKLITVITEFLITNYVFWILNLLKLLFFVF